MIQDPSTLCNPAILQDRSNKILAAICWFVDLNKKIKCAVAAVTAAITHRQKFVAKRCESAAGGHVPRCHVRPQIWD